MTRNVLIAGAASILGSYIAALRLMSLKDSVYCVVQRTELPFSSQELTVQICHAVRQVAPDEDAQAYEAQIASRLHWIPGDLHRKDLGLPEALPRELRIEEIWCLSEDNHSTRRRHM